MEALIGAAASGDPTAYEKVPGISARAIAASQHAVKLAYIKAFQVVFLTAIGFAVLAVGSALLCSSTDPAKKTSEKAVFLENEIKGVMAPKSVGLEPLDEDEHV